MDKLTVPTNVMDVPIDLVWLKIEGQLPPLPLPWLRYWVELLLFRCVRMDISMRFVAETEIMIIWKTWF